jgi:hypothetical protein
MIEEFEERTAKASARRARSITLTTKEAVQIVEYIESLRKQIAELTGHKTYNISGGKFN